MTDDDLMSKARALDSAGLCRLWGQVVARETEPEWGPGKALEGLVLRAFELEGKQDPSAISVCWPERVRTRYLPKNMELEQLDGVVHLGGISFLIECKDRAEEVDAGPISLMRLHLEGRPPCTMGMLFSMGGYKEPARYLAYNSRPLNVLLWEQKDIDWAIRGGGFVELTRRKLRRAIEARIVDHTPAALEVP